MNHPTARPIRASLAALLLLAGCAPASAPADAPQAAAAPKRVRIVHTNDFHGRLHPQTPSWAEGRALGGSAVLAAHFDSARVRFDGPTVVLSAGDDYQGTAISNLSWGRAVVGVQNAARYDAATLGNHEFDWGIDTLRARLSEERFPRLAANVYRAGTTEQPGWIRPWTLIERDGVKVGVIGIALPGTPQIVMAGRTAGLDFGPEAPAIDRAAREARAAGADFVVVTAHIGAGCERPGRAPAEASEGCEGEMLEVARAVREPIDLIVGGHTHQRVLTRAGGVPVVEAASYGTAYSITDLERQGDSTVVLTHEVRTPWADEVDADTMVARVVAEWDAEVRPISEQIVVSFARPMERDGGEYPLGNLIADAFRAQTGADVSIVNNGSIRRPMPAGPISYGVLYELQPFQNQLVTVRVTGAQLKATLENAVSGSGRPDAHLAGMTVRFDASAPVGQRIREIRLASGRVVGATDSVTVGTTEFVATGGDRYGALRAGELQQTGIVDLDGLIDHLKSLPQPVAPPAVGRWVAAR
jgi:2',3'-cyclic-nucleotide 2'-phosphodiesterase (5'-nucleotidase family)